MKIGITCYPTYGGSGVIATELGKQLASKGHKVHFISYAQPFRLSEFNENISYHEVAISDYPLFEYPPYSISLASKILDVCFTEKLDLIHVHYAIPHAISAFLANQFLKEKGLKHLPVVTTLHGTDVTIIGSDPTMKDALNLSINTSNAVTAVSHYLKTTTENLLEKKLPIDVIYNFLNLKTFDIPDCGRYRHAFAQKHEKILIHISNFRKVKRAIDVIEVFNIVQKKLPSKLLLVGDGPDRPLLEMRCRELNICSKVKFLGKQLMVSPLLSISDLMIMPSHSESFGLAALESMACATPVIATNLGGFPELITHNVNGFLCEYKNVKQMSNIAIDILNDEKKISMLKENARERAEDFDVNQILPSYENLYKKILEETK